MHEAKIDRIREQFDSFDKDDDGLIDLQEFLGMIAVLYPDANSSYLEGGFVLMDENCDGYIDFLEFLGWWQEEDWET